MKSGCWPDCSGGDCVQLTVRESEVCNAICASGGTVTFASLKSSTQLHQEILSRILRRLVLHGLARRTDRGYSCGCGQ
ncbi:MAG TPA: hypothetical protein VEJ36_00330 [Nitrososphaerales archaeon]|nr:hypothetical protein [Nitrososphaerales archaeon]